MGRVSGDKSRFNRKRRQKLARRVTMRALAKAKKANAIVPTGKVVRGAGGSSHEMPAKREATP